VGGQGQAIGLILVCVEVIQAKNDTLFVAVARLREAREGQNKGYKTTVYSDLKFEEEV
jgi:hypothetical protein